MEVMKKEGGQDEVHVQAVWFAAGTAALMACLERAVVVSTFVEQCRVLVFLALNLLLLAILFTSTHPNSSPQTQNTPRRPTRTAVEEEEEEEEAALADDDDLKSDADNADVTTQLTDRDGDPVDDFKSADMSKEELNERAEAFIAMFRQHLASDALICL